MPMSLRLAALALAATLPTTALAAPSSAAEVRHSDAANPELAVAASAEPDASADTDVQFVILRENSTGSASAAQTYIDQLLAAIAKSVGWSGASGKYLTRRAGAKSYIEEKKPKFGILSFGAYLGMRKAHGLKPLGQADTSNGGGHQYYVVSKSLSTLDACKGKKLGTNHADTAFVDKVVSGKDFDLSDFDVVDTRRPVKTLKEVAAGTVDCALIDDAQLMELQHIDGGLEVHAVWSSSNLPPMVVVSFPNASPAEVKAFKGILNGLCAGEGKEACKATSIHLSEVDAGAFDKHVASYEG